MRLASHSSTYVLSLWSGIARGAAAATALAFYFLSDLGPHATAILKAYGAGALIAMAAETMIPEAFHNGPRYFRPARRCGLRSPHPSRRTRQMRPVLWTGSPQLPSPCGKLPVRADEVTGVTSGVAVQVILVLGFGFAEIAGGGDLRYDPSRPKTRSIDVGDRILSNALLFLARVEDRRAIACPDVIALAVSRGWIVNLEKEFQQPAVAYPRGVEDNFDRFDMCPVVAIRRVRHVAARVANARRNHAILAANEILQTPEAPPASTARSCVILYPPLDRDKPRSPPLPCRCDG